jgi:hypothetical protein
MGLGLLTAAPMPAQAQWAVEGFLGSARSARSTLTIRQSGFPTLQFAASYDTRPWAQAPYYGVRVSRWWPSGWGVFGDNLHHKLYLSNNPPEVQRFEVTWGYNFIALGAARRSGDWSALAAAGPVLANPTSTVRGRTKPHSGGILGTGYYVDGAHVQAGINRRLHVTPWGFLTADLRVSAAWARVAVVDGTADVPNYAVHFLVGVGAGKKREGRREKREGE